MNDLVLSGGPVAHSAAPTGSGDQGPAPVEEEKEEEAAEEEEEEEEEVGLGGGLFGDDDDDDWSVEF